MRTIQLTTFCAALLFGAASSVAANDPATDPAVDPAQVEQEFKALDTDQNGLVNPSEAQGDLQLSQSFDEYDVNKDAALSMTEYKSFAIAQQDPGMDDDEEEAE